MLVELGVLALAGELLDQALAERGDIGRVLGGQLERGRVAIGERRAAVNNADNQGANTTVMGARIFTFPDCTISPDVQFLDRCSVHIARRDLHEASATRAVASCTIAGRSIRS